MGRIVLSRYSDVLKHFRTSCFLSKFLSDGGLYVAPG